MSRLRPNWLPRIDEPTKNLNKLLFAKRAPHSIAIDQPPNKATLMHRRSFLSMLGVPAVLACIWRKEPTQAFAQDLKPIPRRSRVRPSDANWPTSASWDQLRRDVEGRLHRVDFPLATCSDNPASLACNDAFAELKNPYYNGDQVGLTQTIGWIDAWNFQPSIYAVAAECTQDVIAAVNFARTNNLRLVIKGGGHSFLGTSCAPDSLMIWTRHMNQIVTHDAFVPMGSDATPAPAVTIGAGAIWMHAYEHVTTKGGRYVQGGGCGTVGVAGLVLSGGFGSFSKQFGTAASNLLEAEIVTADGVARIVNEQKERDIFFAIKGGGGGTFGVITQLTLRTHDLPTTFGSVSMAIRAQSDTAFRRLLNQFVKLYSDRLSTPNWGDIVAARPNNTLSIQMSFHSLDRKQVNSTWEPFFAWVCDPSQEVNFVQTPKIVTIPARQLWDADYLKLRVPGAVLFDDRPGSPPNNVFWSANLASAGAFLFGFESQWLPGTLLEASQQDRLVDGLFAATRHWDVELHFQKGLYGASENAVAKTKDTATSPAMLDAFALAIVAGEGPPAHPAISGHTPDLALARRIAQRIQSAAAELKRIAPDTGSYLAESSYFQTDWQKSYWGPNYSKLLAIKETYDPDGLFIVHHGVGSENWRPDGFTRLGSMAP